MSEVYSKTPPTEPGWYWLKNGTRERVARKFPPTDKGAFWAFAGAPGVFSEKHAKGYHFLFGPRVPSADDVVKLEKFYEDYRLSYKE